MLRAEDVVVTLLDIEAIKAELNKQLPPPVDIEYIIDDVALYDENVLISPDAVYYFMCPRVNNGKIENMWDVWVRLKKKVHGGTSNSLMAEFYFTITPKMMPKFYKDVVNLKTFMGGRFNYNPRITRNTRDFLDAIHASNKMP